MTGPTDAAQGIPARYRNPIVHDTGPSAFPGDWQVTDAALGAYGIARELFGTSQVRNFDGTSFRVKDYQYRLPDGSIGMHLLPINDEGPLRNVDGTMVEGCALIDALLRERMGLKPQDQIFAFAYFIHPELNSGTIADFAANDKIELGITHLASYVGGGRTSNSPPLYHNRKWAVVGEPGSPFGYPANVAILSLEGTDQSVLNRNLYLADCVLNNGVRFPIDYKNSQYRMAQLNTAFMFYRDWVLEADYLRKDSSWFTYCAAHKTLVANIGLNLPHNLDSFKDAYGPNEGAEFFKRFCEHHFQVFGTELTEDRQTRFEPLWQKQGLAPERIRSFNHAAYIAWDTARLNGALATFKGFCPLPTDQAMVWPPQTTADLVADFANNYADLIDAGAISFCATVIGFTGQAVQRMRVGTVDYLLVALPVTQAAMRAHARVYAAGAGTASNLMDSAYGKSVFAALFQAFGGTPDALADAQARIADGLSAAGLLQIAKWLAAGTVPPEILAWAVLDQVRTDWQSIIAAGAISLEQAYCDFAGSAATILDAARAIHVGSELGIEYDMQPAIAHLVATGQLPINPHVRLTPVATVMNLTELEPKQKAPTA